jgi:hypothetical protein
MATSAWPDVEASIASSHADVSEDYRMRSTWLKTALSLVLGGMMVSVSGAARADEIDDLIDNAFIVPGDTYFYTGTIGRNLTVQLSLCVISESIAGRSFPPETGLPIRGFHFYESVGTPLDLRGTLRAGQLEMTESQGSKITGRFSGRFDHARLRQYLKWHSPDGARELDAQLMLIGRSSRIQREEGSIWIHREWPTLLCKSHLSNSLDTLLRHDSASSADAAFRDGLLAAREQHSDSHAMSWTDHSQTTLLYFSQSLISFQTIRMTYTGGAHSNCDYGGRCFVIRNGKPRELRLSDLYRPGSNYVERLCKLCEPELRRRGASSLTMEGARNLNRDDLKEFQIKPSGLTMIFNPYTVGCFAEGGYDVEIPWSKLSDLLGEIPEIRRLAGLSAPSLRPARTPRE